MPIKSGLSPALPDPRDQKTHYLKMTPLRWIITATARFISLFLIKLHINGAEYFPINGAVVLAANHITNFDVFPLQFAVPRPIYFMGKEELFRNRILNWAFRQLGGFPVNRNERDEWAIQHSIKVLDQAQVLGIFPEGTRNRGKGLRPAKTGIARFSQVGNYPIVPVAIHGTQYILRKFPHRTAVTVSIGVPIYPQKNETHLGLTERVMFSLADLLPPESRGVYSHRPPGF